MSAALFLQDSYRKTAPGKVVALTEDGGVVVQHPLFYARSGGQPGDQGQLEWAGGVLDIIDTVKGATGNIVLIPAEGQPLPGVGETVGQTIDWDLRYAHMRVHTALHILSVAIPLPVTGGAIGAGRGRLDFLMPDGVKDKSALQDQLNELVARDLPVIQSWISDAELAANPGLVKTMSVAPPNGQGRVRLIAIGEGEARIDLQPCGGTHVARTAEIGAINIGKIENKGRQNRRVNLVLDSQSPAPGSSGTLAGT